MGTRERQPRRWRAEKGRRYWYADRVNRCIAQAIDYRSKTDDLRHAVRNYFATDVEAEEMLRRMLDFDARARRPQ